MPDSQLPIPARLAGRDPQYHEHDVFDALIAEIRRLRSPRYHTDHVL